MEMAEWGREKAALCPGSSWLLSVPQEAQQSQDVHSHSQHRRAKAGECGRTAASWGAEQSEPFVWSRFHCSVFAPVLLFVSGTSFASCE